jgi:hypothetical protein
LQFFSVVLTLFCVEIAGAAYLYFKQEDVGRSTTGVHPHNSFVAAQN